MVEGVALELLCRLFVYRGFESLSFRTLQPDSPMLLIAIYQITMHTIIPTVIHMASLFLILISVVWIILERMDKE